MKQVHQHKRLRNFCNFKDHDDWWITPDSLVFLSLLSALLLAVISINYFQSSASFIIESDGSLDIDMGIVQRVEGNSREIQFTTKVINESEIYLRNVISKPQNDDIRDQCKNQHELCAFWASEGFCKYNYEYMKHNCPLACQSCEEIRKNTVSIDGYNIGVSQELGDDDNRHHQIQEVISISNKYYMEEIVANPDNEDIRDMCINKHELCSFWATLGQCKIKYDFMLSNCALACQSCERIRDRSRIEQYDIGVNQKVEGNEIEIQRTEEVIRLSHQYYLEEIVANPDNEDIRDKCVNKEELCSFWASAGECTAHDVFMQRNCPLACGSCERLKGKDDASEINSDDRIESTVSSRIASNPIYPRQSPTQNRIHRAYPRKKSKVSKV